MKFAEQNGNRNASRHFTVPETNVRDRRKIKRGKKALFPEVEVKLFDFINNLRSGKYAVSGAMIREKALKLPQSLSIPPSQFKTSLGWYSKFLRRHNLSNRRRTTFA